jgi:hypothetical protein
LTKQPLNVESRHAVICAAGEPEVTKAMIAAGERVLVEEIGICGADIAAEISVAVFQAMCRAQIR